MYIDFNQNDNDETYDSKEKTACFMPEFPKECNITYNLAKFSVYPLAEKSIVF